VIKCIGDRDVKKDLFLYISCIEHLMIRAKLIDLIELELIRVAQQKASSKLTMFAETIETHRDLRDTLTGSWPGDDLTNFEFLEYVRVMYIWERRSC
jgi:hypothetical protein